MKENKITDEMLARYITGRANAEEQAEIDACLAEDAEFADEVLNETVATLLQQRSELRHSDSPYIVYNRQRKKPSLQWRVAMRRVAAVAVVGVVGFVLWRLADTGGTDFNTGDNPTVTTAGMGNNDREAAEPCVGNFDYAFPTYEAPKEWTRVPGDTLKITWNSNAPLQRFDYRFDGNGVWHKKEARGRFFFTAESLENVDMVEWRIVVGCNKDNFDALYDTVMIIHK